jgi:hypothetical protein
MKKCYSTYELYVLFSKNWRIFVLTIMSKRYSESLIQDLNNG